MSQRIDDIQRQIEIAGMIFEQPDKYSEEDLASHFYTSAATIRRDVKALRDMGVDICSRKRAYHVNLSLNEINFLITTYFAFGNQETIKNLPLIHEKFRHRTLNFFIQTMKAITNRQEMEIEYKSKNSTQARWRTITPVAFYNAGKSYYLIGIHNDVTKIYTIERIQGVRFPNTPSAVKKIPSLNELFRYSWGSFTGGPVKEVRLLFKDDLEEYIIDKFMTEHQEILRTEQGMEVVLKVKLSNEFISWLLGWGDAVTVLSPPELKEQIIQKARDIVSHYTN